jgi:hypothetical protein
MKNKIVVNYLSVPMDGETKAGVDAMEQHILVFEYDKPRN